jgi:hypothetical protein
VDRQQRRQQNDNHKSQNNMVCGCFDGLFSVRVDDTRVIDIPGSFSSRSIPTQLFKCACLAMTLTAAILFIRRVYVLEEQEQKLQYVYYFAYFTVWGLLASALYFCASWANSCVPLIQTTDAATLRLKYTWVIFEVAAHTELCVTVLYWGLLWTPGDDIKYGGGLANLFAHGGVMLLVLWTGLVVNRVPVRFSHFIFPFTVDVLYLIWSFFHDYYSLGNGLTEQGDDAIYNVIDWDDDFLRTLTLAAFILGVVSPSLWILLWLSSLCGRRYIKIPNDYGSVAYANSQVGRQQPRQQRGWWGV